MRNRLQMWQTKEEVRYERRKEVMESRDRSLRFWDVKIIDNDCCENCHEWRNGMIFIEAIIIFTILFSLSSINIFQLIDWLATYLELIDWSINCQPKSRSIDWFVDWQNINLFRNDWLIYCLIVKHQPMSDFIDYFDYQDLMTGSIYKLDC